MYLCDHSLDASLGFDSNIYIDFVISISLSYFLASFFASIRSCISANDLDRSFGFTAFASCVEDPVSSLCGTIAGLSFGAM